MCVMFFFYNFLLRSAAELRPPCHARPNDAEKWKSGKKQQKQLQQTTTATTTTALAVKVFQFFVSSLHLHASVCVCIFSALKYECICISESFFLFASHFRCSPLALALPEDEVRRLPLLLWRKLQRIIFTLRQRIWSVSSRCLYVCVCVCMCVHILRLPHVVDALRLWPLAFVILRYGNQYY